VAEHPVRAGRVEAPEGGSDDDARWAVLAARAAATKTDASTLVLDVGEVLGIVRWFVVTDGRNPRQVKTIAEEVERLVAEAGGPRPLRVEGLSGLEWVLLDYGDLVVHVFHRELRSFYDLERLFSDVPRLAWEDGDAGATDALSAADVGSR
jgi:ribosome-associated protein